MQAKLVLEWFLIEIASSVLAKLKRRALTLEPLLRKLRQKFGKSNLHLVGLKIEALCCHCHSGPILARGFRLNLLPECLGLSRLLRLHR
jgi:hypothetical protein